MAEPEDRFIQIGEAAQICRLSRTVLRRMVAQGLLPAWRTPGGHFRFTRSDCVEFSRSLGRDEDEISLIGTIRDRDRERIGITETNAPR
jgi:excisionase family DNA binding protein